MSFADAMMAKLNDGATCLMLSIGHRTGLFDCMSAMEPASSKEIAARAELNERYVREWLDAMTVSGVCHYDADQKTYFLPKVHAEFLTRKSTLPNFAVMAQFIGMLGSVEDKIVNCFQNGGGVDYTDFHRFHEIMAEESGQTVLPALIDSIIPLADGLREKLESGITVADVGCGRGRAIRKMGRAYPKSKFTGFDIGEDAIGHANDETGDEGLKNVEFKVQDVAKMEFEDEFDLITAFDSIHDQAQPDVVLANIYKALKPGGIFLMQDIGTSKYVEQNMEHPVAPLIYTISCMHCMTVSLAQGGAGLGAAWGVETAKEMLIEAGFKKVETHKLDHDPLNCFFVVEK